MIQANAIPKVWVCMSALFSVSFNYRIDWQCDWDVFKCDSPYSMEQTLQFRCRKMGDCPENFMCCSHKCFRHKICQPFKNIPHIPKSHSDNSEIESGQCNVIVTCDRPLLEAFTRPFECFEDNDCPDYYKCCLVSCYNHKVCQPAKDIFIGTTISTAGSVSTSTVITSPTTTSGSLIKFPISTTSKKVTFIITSESSTKPSIATITPEATTYTTANERLIQPSVSTTSRPTMFTISSKNSIEPSIAVTKNKYTTASISLIEPITSTSSETTMYITESPTESSRSTTQNAIMLTTISTRNTVMNGDDVGGNGNSGTIHEYEKKKDGTADTTTSTLTTPQNSKNISDLTKHVKTTVSQFVPTELSTGSDDFTASGDSGIIDDDEDETEDDSAIILTSKLISSISSVTTTQGHPFTGSTGHLTETNDFDASGDAGIYEDDTNMKQTNNYTITSRKTELEASTEIVAFLTSHQAITTTSSAEIIKSSDPPSVSDTTFSSESDNWEASGDFYITGDDEDEKENDKDKASTIKSINNSTTFSLTTFQKKKQNENSNKTIATTTQIPLWRGSTKPFTETVDIETSGDIEITGDDEDTDDNSTIISTTESNRNTDFATFLTTHQITTITNSAEVFKTNQTPSVSGTTINSENDNFGASGDFLIIGDDEDKGKEEENRNDASNTKLISDSTTFTLTTLQQAKDKENFNETIVTTIQTPPLRESTEYFTESVNASGDSKIIENYENADDTISSATELNRNTEFATIITTHQTISGTSSSGIIKTNQPPSITGKTLNSESDNFEASGDFFITGDDEDKGNDEKVTLTTRQETKLNKNSNETIVSTTQAKLLGELTVPFTETVNIKTSGDTNIIGYNDDTVDTSTTTSTTELKRSTVIPTFVTTDHTTIETSSAEVIKTNQPTLVNRTSNLESDNFESSGDFFISGDDEDEGKEEGDIDNATLQHKKHNENSNERILTTTQIPPLEESTTYFTETINAEANGNIIIIGDDEDTDTNNTTSSTSETISNTELAVVIISNETTSRTSPAEIIKMNKSFSVTGTTFSPESDDIEGSGTSFITGDDEDDANEKEEENVSASPAAKLMHITKTSAQQSTNKSITSADDLETSGESGDIHIIEDDEEI